MGAVASMVATSVSFDVEKSGSGIDATFASIYSTAFVMSGASPGMSLSVV